MIARVESRQITALGAKRMPRLGQQKIQTLEVRHA